jgi:hypothetical protein
MWGLQVEHARVLTRHKWGLRAHTPTWTTAGDAQAKFEDRAAALYCFQCALYKNQEKQLHNIAGVAGQNVGLGKPAGPLLIQGLFAPPHIWFAALSFSHMLIGLRDAKEKFERVALQVQGLWRFHLSSVRALFRSSTGGAHGQAWIPPQLTGLCGVEVVTLTRRPEHHHSDVYRQGAANATAWHSWV